VEVAAAPGVLVRSLRLFLLRLILCSVVDIQVKVGGEWKYQPRLVSWYGPCDYSYSGLVMEKNLNWAPELLDLLHR
jgi:hypothetical protein